ncbi:thiol peroxidase [Corallincola luteus]|uniref:Thiol peroxidase n=1 Tax=Corallincola luteus TaxID=1775177 RepID=A0ABY2ALR0_9GAMM|nr:thiol peroxidase [Corallincola luteus]TCI03861.1 thiol peroxidase [Corallincola luteus]
MLRLPFVILTVCLSFSAWAELTEREGLVTAGGQPLVLLGSGVEVGQPAPEFKVVDSKFAPILLSDYQGKTVLLSVVPSIDTGVCSLQTKRFNSEVAKLPADVILITLSTDLPFAQKRFCEVENVDKMPVLSDAVWRNFGEQYGLLIKDRGLLARAILIIDKDGKLQYQELVKEVSEHPDYDAALAMIKKLHQD